MNDVFGYVGFLPFEGLGTGRRSVGVGVGVRGGGAGGGVKTKWQYNLLYITLFLKYYRVADVL